MPFSYCSWGSQGKNTKAVCHSLLQWAMFCQNSPPLLGGPWFHWVRQGCGPCDQFDQFSVIVVFILSALWWRRIRGLWKLPDGRDWLNGKLCLVLMGGAMLSKSLTQFSVDGRDCVPSLWFDLRPNYGGGNEDHGDLLQKFPWCTAALSAPSPAAGHRRPTSLPETPKSKLWFFQ